MQTPLQEFIEYCDTFYGEDGIYDMNATLEQIQQVCCFYITYMGDAFTCDTMAREIVRDLLTAKYGLCLDPPLSEEERTVYLSM